MADEWQAGEHVESLTNDELLEWVVYPDTGEFPDHLHRESK